MSKTPPSGNFDNNFENSILTVPLWLFQFYCRIAVWSFVYTTATLVSLIILDSSWFGYRSPGAAVAPGTVVTRPLQPHSLQLVDCIEYCDCSGFGSSCAFLSADFQDQDRLGWRWVSWSSYKVGKCRIAAARRLTICPFPGQYGPTQSHVDLASYMTS